MSVKRTSIEGLLVVESETRADDRGFFRESYRWSEVEQELGRPLRFRQSNHSRSHSRVLRGFHSEPWDKLVYVVRGTAFVAIADTRPSSPTFGQSLTFVLGDSPGRHSRVFVQKGLSNAFYCFTEVDYINEVSEEFDPATRGGVLWSDATLNVAWPDRQPILSRTDSELPSLRELHPDHALFRSG